jgi:HlyD family secretion protein
MIEQVHSKRLTGIRRLARRPGAWIALGVLLASAGIWTLRMRGPQVRTCVAVRRNLEQHIVASGRVWVPTRVQIAAQNTGLVVSVAVREGQRVATGDLLVQLDDSEARAATAQAEASVAQASARVDQLRRVGAIVATSELRQAQTNLERAQTDLERVVRLEATGAVPHVELENAQRSVAVTRAQATAAEARQLSLSPRGADSRIVLTALLAAQAQLVAANVRLAQTKIVALQGGTVLTRSVEPGDVVQPSKSMLVLAAGDDAAQLVFQSDERNIAAIHLEQEAQVSADAYPQQRFSARVNYLAPSIDPARGSIEVRLRVLDPPPYLKPDMTVSIDLTVAAERGVLTLPSDAVRGAASATPWVLAVEDQRVVRKEIELGLRGDGAVEVRSGLTETTEVILPGRELLKPGQRVQATREDR